MMKFRTEGQSVVAVMEDGREGVMAVATAVETAIMIVELLNDKFEQNKAIDKKLDDIEGMLTK